MNELTKEDVLHVAHLARIELKDEEIEKYIYQLNQIKDEMDKLTLVESGSDDICISPTENTNVYRCDEYVNKEFDVTKNAPKSNGNYIEIKRFVND